MTHPTYSQIADDFRLWGERFDTGAEMTREEFDALTIGQKGSMLVDAFGAESAAESTVVIDGRAVDFDAAANLMDDDIREALNSSIGGCSPQEFIDAYAAAHEAKFGEDFRV